LRKSLDQKTGPFHLEPLSQEHQPPGRCPPFSYNKEIIGYSVLSQDYMRFAGPPVFLKISEFCLIKTDDPIRTAAAGTKNLRHKETVK